MNLSPDISLPAVAFSTDHLWTHPVGGAGHRADPSSRHADGLKPFAGTKISKLHVSLRVPQDVGTLDTADLNLTNNLLISAPNRFLNIQLCVNNI